MFGISYRRRGNHSAIFAKPFSSVRVLILHMAQMVLKLAASPLSQRDEVK
jgi:hypothetical protein